jgi:hypothetical protein
MTNQGAFRAWLIAFFLCAIVVIFSIAYVDRPVADYVSANFLDSHFFALFGKQLGRLAVFVGLGFAFLGACGLWVVSGRRLPSWTEVPLRCSWSLMWATGATVTLKRAFGRSDVQMWTGSTPDEGHVGIHGFHFLRGTPPRFDDFPSGTTAIAAAIIAVVWILAPRLRLLCVLALVFISIGLVITNSHFVADVIAGIFVGWSVGWMTVRLLRGAA